MVGHRSGFPPAGRGPLFRPGRRHDQRIAISSIEGGQNRRETASDLHDPALEIAFAQPPLTPKRPVVDTYHGVKITDDYRWLEDAKVSFVGSARLLDYVDQLNISVLCDGSTLEDPHEVTDAMLADFIEIRKAAGLSDKLTVVEAAMAPA